MNRIFINLILLFSLTLPLAAQEGEGIRFFHGTWEEALQKAKQENKLIFVDCYTVWCGPCANMAKNVFPLKEVGDFFNKHFICMKSEMEKEKDGIMLRERYNVVAYPTYLFITSEGYAAYRSSGFLEADKFIAIGQKALEIGNNGYEERFAKGERDEAFLKEYVSASVDSHAADLVENILNQLYEEQGAKILRDSVYWTAFDCCAADTEAPLSLAFLKDYKKLRKTHGAFAVDQKARNLYASIAKVLTLYDRQGRKEVVSQAKKDSLFAVMAERKVPHYEMLQQEIDFILLLRAHQYEEACALGEKALADADARTLCNWATLGERLTRDNGEIRRKMAEWMKRAIEAGVDPSMQEEAEAVLNDLTTSDRPILQKGQFRKSIPIRGYLSK